MPRPGLALASMRPFRRCGAPSAMLTDGVAINDLRVLVQLKPSHAGGWRKLGMILANHGGTFEADHADEALRGRPVGPLARRPLGVAPDVAKSLIRELM